MHIYYPKKALYTLSFSTDLEGPYIKCTDQIDLIKSKINVTVKSLFPDNFITFFYPLIYRFVRS